MVKNVLISIFILVLALIGCNSYSANNTKFCRDDYSTEYEKMIKYVIGENKNIEFDKKYINCDSMKLIYLRIKAWDIIVSNIKLEFCIENNINHNEVKKLKTTSFVKMLVTQIDTSKTDGNIKKVNCYTCVGVIIKYNNIRSIKYFNIEDCVEFLVSDKCYIKNIIKLS